MYTRAGGTCALHNATPVRTPDFPRPAPESSKSNPGKPAMVRRLLVLPVCFLALTAFSDGAKQELAAACADSLAKRQARGQETPAALVKNRTPICKCVADAVADEAEISGGDKPKVTKVFALVAAGDMEAARTLRLALGKPVHTALRRITRDCAREFEKAGE